MKVQEKHPIIANPNHDEDSRTKFVYQLSNYLRSDITPNNEKIYKRKLLPEFIKKNGNKPQNRHQVRKIMESDPQYQITSALQRASQEYMWSSVADTVERQLPLMIDHYRKIKKDSNLGSLTLSNNLQIPSYLTENHHHCMAGGYHTETREDDVAMGALYERGTFIYVDGNFGPKNDGLGVALSLFIKSKFNENKIKRILDIGCTVGASTVALKEFFPEAEVWGIDVSAPCLRYAHARAEHLNVAVHFSQENAEKTSFADGYFDLVTSAAMLHETSKKATENIIKESRRLLKHKGIMVHQEIQPYKNEDEWIDFTRDWDTYNNNEPYWGSLLDLNLAQTAKENGWFDDKVFTEISFGPAEAKNINPQVQANKVMGASRGARGMNYLCGIKS